MKYRQTRTPRLGVRDMAGNCLIFARRVFWDNPLGGMPTAWTAWQKSKHKHLNHNFPTDAAVFVWWDWTGDIGYGRQRYGHCAVHVPGKGILSSPPRGYGQAWFRTVDDLSRVFGAKYVGWSEDMGGHRVAQPVSTKTTPKPEQLTTLTESEEEEMRAVYYMKGKTYHVMVFSAAGLCSEYTTTTSAYNNEFAKLVGSFAKVSQSHYNALKRDLQKVREHKA